MVDLSEEEIERLYAWIDEVPLSRHKKNLTRDFSDGVLAAEVVNHYFPKIVNLHNYSPANSTNQKLENWRTLNRKVFAKLYFNVPDNFLQSIATCKHGVVEYVLNHLKTKIENYIANGGQQPDHSSTSGYPYSHHHDTLPTTTTAQMAWVHSTTAGNSVTNTQQDVNRHSVLSPASGGESYTQLPSLHSKSSLQAQHHLTSRLPVPAAPRQQQQHYQSSTYPQPQHSLPPLKQHRPTAANSGFNNRTKTLGPAARRNHSKVQIMMAEKDQAVMELQETIQLLQMKVNRLEHLARIKDMKIEELERQLMNNIPKR